MTWLDRAPMHFMMAMESMLLLHVRPHRGAHAQAPMISVIRLTRLRNVVARLRPA